MSFPMYTHSLSLCVCNSRVNTLPEAYQNYLKSNKSKNKQRSAGNTSKVALWLCRRVWRWLCCWWWRFVGLASSTASKQYSERRLEWVMEIIDSDYGRAGPSLASLCCGSTFIICLHYKLLGKYLIFVSS